MAKQQRGGLLALAAPDGNSYTGAFAINEAGVVAGQLGQGGNFIAGLWRPAADGRMGVLNGGVLRGSGQIGGDVILRGEPGGPLSLDGGQHMQISTRAFGSEGLVRIAGTPQNPASISVAPQRHNFGQLQLNQASADFAYGLYNYRQLSLQSASLTAPIINNNARGLYTGGEIKIAAAPVPEPATWLLALCGLLLLGHASRSSA